MAALWLLRNAEQRMCAVEEGVGGEIVPEFWVAEYDAQWRRNPHLPLSILLRHILQDCREQAGPKRKAVCASFSGEGGWGREGG
jgi:hypothetical protein